jgi:hypothetical protein
MGRFEETLQGPKIFFSPPTLIVTIINDSKEDEVEVIIIEPKTFQLVGLEHLIGFSL